MNDYEPGQIGKFLILFGLIVVSVGLVITLLSRLGVFRLPGDLQFGSKNWRIFIPITSCVVISVILTIILWIINLFRG